MSNSGPRIQLKLYGEKGELVVVKHLHLESILSAARALVVFNATHHYAAALVENSPEARRAIAKTAEDLANA